MKGGVQERNRCGSTTLKRQRRNERKEKNIKRVMMHENTLTTHMGDINEGERYKSPRELIFILNLNNSLLRKSIQAFCSLLSTLLHKCRQICGTLWRSLPVFKACRSKLRCQLLLQTTKVKNTDLSIYSRGKLHISPRAMGHCNLAWIHTQLVALPWPFAKSKEDPCRTVQVEAQFFLQDNKTIRASVSLF